MALERGKLSNVVRVAAGATVGIATCTSGKKVYIKSIIAHAAGLGSIGTATGQVYFTQAGVTTGPTTKIFDVDILAGETILLEPAYPIVLAEKRRYTCCWNRKYYWSSSNTRQLYDHRR